jgi:hypothetical protein
MFAAFNWQELLLKMEMGAVLGGVGGACAGLIAYLTRKSDARQHAEFESRERARLEAQMHGKANTTTNWPVLIVILLVIGGSAFVACRSFVASRLPGGSEAAKPSATIADYGRYRDKGPIRVVPDQNASGGVSVTSFRDYSLVEQTDQIPCRVGETWGMRIHTSDLPANRPYTVRKEMHHPPLKEPDGTVRMKSVREFKVPPGAALDSFFGWYFLKGYEYELVPGEWTIVVFIDDDEVARKVFKIQK